MNAKPSRPCGCRNACWAALAFSGVVATAPANAQRTDVQAQLLDTVVITDRAESYKAREASAAGALGSRQLIDTPFSINVITESMINDQQARLLTEVLRNEPAAVPGFGSGYSSYQTVSLRGYALGYNTNYRRDGLPFTHFSETPFENVEQVEVLKGLSGFMNGFAAPGGIINVVPKKPTAKPLASVRAGITSQSLLLLHGDIGGRFGEGDRFGYRVNLAQEAGEASIHNVDIRRTLASAYLDWRLTPDLVVALDVESHRIRQTGQPLYYNLAAGVPVPSAPDLAKFNGVSYATYNTDDTMFGLHADWSINTNWTLSAKLLDHKHDRDAWFSPGTITNAAGAMTVTIQRDAVQAFPARSAQVALAGKFATGSVKHEVTAGLNRNTNQSYRGDYQFSAAYASNLNNPVAAPATALYAVRPQYKNASYEERGIFLSDTLSFGQRFQLIAGARRTSLDQRNFNFAGTQTSAYDKSATTPSIAMIFKPQGNLSLYASLVEGLEQGGTAPVGRVNAGEVFGPLKSKQIEAGMKWDASPAFGLTGALFKIDKGLEYTDTATNRYVQDGRQVHKGIELAAVGNATSKLSIQGGMMFLDPTAEKTGNVLVDGKRPVNVPRRTFTLFADYKIGGVPGLAINGGYQYIGDRALDTTNDRFIEGYGLLNVGMRYETSVAGKKAVLRATIDNLANKNYWAAATPSLHAGLPRTIKLAAQLDF